VLGDLREFFLQAQVCRLVFGKQYNPDMLSPKEILYLTPAISFSMSGAPRERPGLVVSGSMAFCVPAVGG